MKNGNIHILDLDFEYKLWKNKLSYFTREINLLVDRVNVLKRELPEMKLDSYNMKLIDF